MVTVRIRSRQNFFLRVKMTTAKWTINTGDQQDLLYPAARFNEKRCLLVWGQDVIRATTPVPACNPAN
jgi:hypothetical protein